MIKIYFDNTGVFFEFEGAWLGTLLYIGNNKFYLKAKTNERLEDTMLFQAYNYIDAILRTLDILGQKDDRINRACQMTAQMLTRGGDLTTKN